MIQVVEWSRIGGCVMEKKDIKLFRTDGVRGRFGQPPLDEKTVRRIGHAIAQLCHDQTINSIAIARDTRKSGPTIESWLASTLQLRGIRIISLGFLPTPGLAYMVPHLQAGLGMMITASHNPYQDNGIKLFGPDGAKIPLVWTDTIERYCQQAEVEDVSEQATIMQGGKDNAYDYLPYASFCMKAVGTVHLRGWHIVLDVAHGAMFEVAPYVFKTLGASVISLHDQPNGRNINEGCGATDLSSLQKAVIANSADIGLAFDGDGDRLQAVNSQGEALDGDDILWILANFFSAKPGGLSKVVGTVMTNCGLEKAFAAKNIDLIRTDVGDQNMYRALVGESLPLAAETSGHILYLPSHLTGDGLIAALWLLKACVESGFQRDEACKNLQMGWHRFVQMQAAVRIPDGKEITDEMLSSLKQQAGAMLQDQGRFVIRSSGTEPVVRIMVESEDGVQAQAVLCALEKKLKVFWG